MSQAKPRQSFVALRHSEHHRHMQHVPERKQHSLRPGRLRVLLAWGLVVPVWGCAPRPRLVLRLTNAPSQVRKRSLPHSVGVVSGIGELHCRYIGSETVPSSRLPSSVCDPLSTAGRAGTVYDVPVAQLARTVFGEAAAELAPTLVDDAATLACSVEVRLDTFRLNFKAEGKGRAADCYVKLKVEFRDYEGHGVFCKSMDGKGRSRFDGSRVPDAVWIAVYQASARWLAAAKDSADVAAALRAIAGRERLEADAWIVSVDSARHLADAHASDYSVSHHRKVATELAGGLLRNWKSSERRPIAVVAFEMRGPGAKEQELGPQLADMLTTALGEIAGSGVEIIERQQLIRLLEERDLTIADLVGLPDDVTRRKLNGVSYLVFGSVSYRVSQTR